MAAGIAQGYPDWQRTSQRTGLPIVTSTGVSVPASLNLGTFYVGNFSHLRIYAACLTATGHSLSLSWANTPTDFMFGGQTVLDSGNATAGANIRDCVPCQGNWVSIDLFSTANPSTWDVQIIPTDLAFRGANVLVNAVLASIGSQVVAAAGVVTAIASSITGGLATFTVHSDGLAWVGVVDTSPFGSAAFPRRVVSLKPNAAVIGGMSQQFDLPRQRSQITLVNLDGVNRTLQADLVMDL